MNELLPLALGVVQDSYTLPPDGVQLAEGEEPAFGLNVEEDMNYAMTQFSKRVERIRCARTQTIEQLYQIAEPDEALA